jgi:short subunit dehydrogenase-like uncharacterized protein
MSERDLDIVLWGATGFTGRLVAEYLWSRYGGDGDLRWAIAGRNEEKLRALQTALAGVGADDQLPVIVADSNDPASLEPMVARTRVICTTVGPYAKYGTPLVEACARAGTHYCDLTGEVQWMAKTIRQFGDLARESGARIVHTCGFDSIPSDLGTWFVQQAMIEQHGVPGKRVHGRVGRSRGGASGGTVASLLGVLEEAGRDKNVRKILRDPYSLCPDDAPRGPDRGEQTRPRWDQQFRQWTAPFVMAAINERVVRRSNAVMGFPWGESFGYDEAQLCKSRAQAMTISAALGSAMFGFSIGPIRKLLSRFLPEPGEGPDQRTRERGFYELFFHAEHPDDRRHDLVAKVTGDRDPGYGSTSKMLAESAVCLAKDDLEVGGGFWTPSSAMGAKLLERLRSNAGLTFEIL